MADPEHTRRPWWLVSSSEFQLRDYIWGLLIVAFGLFTVIGMFFLFGG